MRNFLYKHVDGSVSDIILLDGKSYERMVSANKYDESILIEVDSNFEKPTRYFRSAWVFENGKLECDLAKSKEIKKDKLRELRKPLLEALDVEYQRADETDDAVKKSEVAAKKQALRDVTSLPLPDDIQELKDFMPEVLK